MTGAELEKRHEQGDRNGVTKAPTRAITPPGAESQTMTWHDDSDRKQDNKYLRKGHRSDKADHLEIVSSLTFCTTRLAMCTATSSGL
ncbi:hypothetical protein N7454_004650 [Penicillium verhagenii]|nr:hypothetical protein N7454_004650 [Penicillium verhagenii]